MAKKKQVFTKKKQDPRLHVCEECLEIFDETEIYLVQKSSFTHSSQGKEFLYWILNCEKCAENKDVKKPISNRKKKVVIDTSNFVEGKPTAKGNKRYLFINSKGKEVSLLAETGIKNGFEPVLKEK